MFNRLIRPPRPPAKTNRRTARTLIGAGAALSAMLTLSACSPFTVLNGAVPADGRAEMRDIVYGPHPRQRLDVYAPEHARSAPVVVFFYGGSWRSGDRADYRFVGDALASRGIVAVVADYRLYPDVRYPGFVQDGAAAVAWTLAHAAQFGGDTERVFVAGHSAGGYIAAMLALDPRWLDGAGTSPDKLAGWIGMAGPYDFLPVESRDVRPVFHYPDSPADSQPLAHAQGHSPPALLLTGTADRSVDPARNTGGLAQALRAAGTCVAVIEYRGLGHPMLVGALSRPLRWRAPVLEDISRFVTREAGRPSSGDEGATDVAPGPCHQP